MTRPYDWSPLASADPVPGDPVELAAIADRHARMAEELTTQAANLRTLASSDGWDADAGRRFADSAGQVAGHLEKARGRYAAVAEGVRGYIPYLQQAQREADAALSEAKSAQATMSANRAVDPTMVGPTADPTDPAVAAERQRRQNAYNGGADALARARQKLANAVALRDEKARRAAAHIRQTSSNDGLKDGFWDQVKAKIHSIASVLSCIANIASWVATVAGVLSIFLGWVPILGQVLLAVTLIATSISLLCHLALAISGDGSWLDVGLDAIGLLTFGYGKVVTRGVSAAKSTLAKQALRGARNAARNRLRQQFPRLAKAALRRRAQAIAKEAVKTATQAKPSLRLVARTLDVGNARELAQVKALATLGAGRTGVTAAEKAVVSAYGRQAVASAFGSAVDATDKAGGWDWAKPTFQSGPYAPVP